MKLKDCHIRIIVCNRCFQHSKMSTFACVAIHPETGDILYRLSKDGEWLNYTMYYSQRYLFMTYDNLIRHLRKHHGRIRFRNTEYTKHVLLVAKREIR